MKKVIAFLLVLSGCGPTMTKDGCHHQDWTCRARYEKLTGENVDACINRKLDEMSDADHTANWSAELLRELHRICRDLYPYGSDKPVALRGKGE